MFTLLRTLSVGYLSQHRLRSLLVVLSIALGVATLVATQALNKSIKRGVQEGVNPVAGLADLLVVNGQTGVPASLAAELKKAGIDGVENVTPFVLWRISLADLDNRVIWLLGVEWPKGKEQQALADRANPLGVAIRQTYQPKSWTEKLALALAPPVLVSENLYRDLLAKDPKLRRFKLRNAGRTPEVTLMGTVSFAGTDMPLQDSSVVVMDLHSASVVCFPEKPGHVHQIGVSLVKGASEEKVRDDIKAWLAGRADVQSIDASRQLVSDVTAGLEIGFAIGGAGALVIGLFLVYNALSVSVAERRHDIGILRSVGATRWQIARLFVSESLVMGLFGSFLGLPLGWAMAWVAVKPMASVVSELMVPIDRARIEMPWWLVLLALSAGTIVAILAALVPALQAAGEEPADAVRRAPRRNALFMAGLQIGGTLLLLLAGFLLAHFRHDLPARTGMFGGVVCLLLGGLLSTPLLSTLVGHVVQPFFRYFLGLEGRLAADNMVRAPGRTGLVIAALAATGGLMVQTAGFLKSTREAIRDWIDDKIAADLFVTSGSTVTSGGAALSMQESFKETLAAVPGVEAVLGVRFLRIDYRSPLDGKSRIVFLTALDMEAFGRSDSERPLARSLEKLRDLKRPGNVVVSENFASLYGVDVGDTITLRSQSRQLHVEIVGKVTDYSWNRGTIFLDRAWFREEFSDHQVDVFDLFLKPGYDPQTVRKDLMARFGQKEALFAVTRPDIHRDVSETLRKVYSLAYAQQMVVGMVALLGVVSALFISVLQRRRELGLLRAVGATRAQILRSVLAEAVLMGIVGAAVGFGIGLLLEWYVMDVMLLDESGFEFPLRVPWLEAGVVSLASVVFATLAGLWPAYQATRLRIPEAIAYE